MVYLIERVIPSYEMKHIFHDNTRRGRYTLFIVWGEMLLPENGQIFMPDEWLVSILDVYQNTVYTYEIYMGHLFVYPVHFDYTALPGQRSVRYGEPLDVGTIACHSYRTRIHTQDNMWRVATFDAEAEPYHRQRFSAQQAKTRQVLDDLRDHYTLFGLNPGLNRAEIKRAYRRMARTYHPDLNSAPTAKHKMQQLNHAYDTIMRQLDTL